MSEKISFNLPFDEDLARHFKQHYAHYADFRILSKSLDARGAARGKKPIFQYILEVIKPGEQFKDEKEDLTTNKEFKNNPIIVGAGPAGLFAALRLSDYGLKATVIERGEIAHKRMLHISKYWKHGVLNTESNVCFGEGGAGLFSDGKLITRVKSPFIKYVMKKFVEFGAPEETAYISNPHLGSNKIRQIIGKITDHLKANGHEFLYNVAVSEVLFEGDKTVGVKLTDGSVLKSDHVILATGHSAGDMYKYLAGHDVAMKQKDFAVGVRIEHPRQTIDQLQHGKYHESEFLGSARYRLSYYDQETKKGTYSFCMCPGGYVLSSGTEKDGIVVNGMSNYARNSRWSNSAIVVTVNAGDDFNDKNILAGMDFQHAIEQKAYQCSVEEADGRALPAMTVGEFISGKLTDDPLPKTSCPSSLFKTDIRKLFPDFVVEHLRNGLEEFNKKIKGFSTHEAVLIAPETRTSAPVTIARDKESLESTSHKGLYPAGEGAGYAGGITSAAVDGIRIVEAILH